MSPTARAIVLIIAGLALLGALVLSIGPGGGGFPLFALALLLILGVVFERRYTGGHAGHPEEAIEWQPTGERFIDPESGKSLEVWADPLTGARRYEPLADADSHPQLVDRR